jgi:hypothetical protein
MTCGIYLGSPISNSTHKVYIGQSVDVEDRVKKHNYNLKNNSHNNKMNEAYKLYGPFTWEILHECSLENLSNLEEYYIKLFNSVDDGFNIYRSSTEAPILHGILNGKVNIDRLNIYYEIIKNSLIYTEYTKIQIASISNATIQEVDNLWCGTAYTWVEEFYPEEYAKLSNLRGTRKLGGRNALEQGISIPPLIGPDQKEYTIVNIREFAKEHNLDKGDLNKLLHYLKGCIGGYIVKDLDILSPETHNKFMLTKRSPYSKQFNKYKGL